MSSDDYEAMDPEFREKVELLDMWDVNNLTPDDLRNARQFFVAWLQGNVGEAR